MGLRAGAGIAGALASVLLATPAAAAVTEIVRVLDPVAYAASVLCIVLACVLAASLPALLAARIDPVVTLRLD